MTPSAATPETAPLSYHLIFNPVAGQGQPGTKLVEIESALDDLTDLTVHLTKPDLGATTLAEQAIAAGADVLIVAGGDGTISGAASVVVDEEVPLGIIPTGTVNGFATALGIPDSLLDACHLITMGHRQSVDTARCNGHLMLLDTCIGFEAGVLTRMERDEKQQLGRLAVVRNSLEELQEIEQFVAHVDADNCTWHESATSIMIANTATLGMVLAQGPADISAEDGNLSITLVTPDHELGVLTSAADLFFSALQRRTVEGDTIRSCKASKVVVETDPPQKVFVDGESAGETPLIAECHPRSLSVFLPPSQADVAPM